MRKAQLCLPDYGGDLVKDIKLFDITAVKNLDRLFAHTKNNGKEREFLTDHLDLVYEYFLKLYDEKNLHIPFERMASSFFKEEQAISLWKELMCNAIYLHDFGKVNKEFQYKKMGNTDYQGDGIGHPYHSMLSAYLYYHHYFSKIKATKLEKGNKDNLFIFLFINCYVISKHHSHFDSLKEFHEKFVEANNLYKEHPEIHQDYKLDNGTCRIPGFDKIQGLMKKLEKWESIDLFIYSRLLYSCLCASDYYATGEYMNGKEVTDFGVIDNIDLYFDLFKQSKVYKGIRKHKNHLAGEGPKMFEDNDINRLRSEMFLEAEEELLKHMEENIFYLEAPTGSGKTNTSINLACTILKENKDLNKIFYVFPFNTLVEQTEHSLYKAFGENEEIMNNVAVINSLTPMKEVNDEKTEDNNEKIDYERTLLNRQFLHYPIVLTSHVHLFSNLFGIGREEIFPLAHLCNSVIILDEIQSYKNSIWKEIIIFLQKYAKLLNIKVIIMSATLPALDLLIDEEISFPSLITNRNKYYDNPLFKNRVELDFSLLQDEPISQKILVESILSAVSEGKKKILIECIKKKTAMDLYKKIKSGAQGKTVLLMTGDDNKAERKRIIKSVAEESDIILVATQVVEAGVDIDMDIGYKNISTLDGEEQFLGRINRSCRKRGSKVYFFEIDEADTIYKGDFRKGIDMKKRKLSLKSQDIQDLLHEKDFASFYQLVFEKIEHSKTKNNSHNLEEFRIDTLCCLDYTEIKEWMKLIDENEFEYTIFLDVNVKDEHGNILIGSDIWEEYKEILKDSSLPYAKQKKMLSDVTAKMNYFTYTVNSINSWQDRVGNVFYFENGEEFFEDEKFDREKFQEQTMFIV